MRRRLALLAGVAAAAVLFVALASGIGDPMGSFPAYARFTSEAADLPTESEYDYIIVGGGTAGCPLAATLSTRARVLLLERGGAPHEFPELSTQAGFLQTLAEANSSPLSSTPAQAFTSAENVPNARGRVLGGSSAINAGFYSRAHADWFRLGSDGKTSNDIQWDMAAVNASYEWVERVVAYEPAVRGWQLAVRDALLAANVTPWNGFTLNHVVGTKVGATTFDASGRRHSAADLLALGNQSNLVVALRANVDRVLLSPLSSASRRERLPPVSAVGVVFHDRYGRAHRAMLRPGGEVIISAGALGSPQLLMLSGIGPVTELNNLGINVAVKSPDVGRHLYDNPRNGISIAPATQVDHSLIQVVGIPAANGTASYLEAASYAIAFETSPGNILYQPSSLLYVTVATIMEKVPGPASEGRLSLQSLNSAENPAVQFNYFQNPEDLTRCVEGLRRVSAIVASPAIDKLRSPEGIWGAHDINGGGRRPLWYIGPPLPRNWTDDSAVAEFCRKTVATLWHYHGGCVMGKVVATLWHYHGGCVMGKVVDRLFRVSGVRSLRVVDGSTFAVSPGTNPQATVMMLGRYAGLKMIEEMETKGRRRPARSEEVFVMERHANAHQHINI